MYWAVSRASTISRNPAHKPTCHHPPRFIARSISNHRQPDANKDHRHIGALALVSRHGVGWPVGTDCAEATRPAQRPQQHQPEDNRAHEHSPGHAPLNPRRRSSCRSSHRTVYVRGMSLPGTRFEATTSNLVRWPQLGQVYVEATAESAALPVAATDVDAVDVADGDLDTIIQLQGGSKGDRVAGLEATRKCRPRSLPIALHRRRTALPVRPVSRSITNDPTSSGSIDVASVINPEHRHGSLPLIDPIQDAVGTSSCAVDASELVPQFAADATGILDQRPGDEVNDGGADRFGQSFGDRTRRWTGDDQFVAALGHDVGEGRNARTASTPLTTSPTATAALGLDELPDRVMVAEEFEGLFETVEIVGADQHGGGSTVAGDDDAFVFTVDAVDEFGESILHVPQRVRRHGHDCATPRDGRQPTRSSRPGAMHRPLAYRRTVGPSGLIDPPHNPW